MSTHIDYHIGVDILYLRIDVLDEIIHSLVLQTHTVEHPRGGLRHAGIVVSFPMLERGTLDYDAPQFV